MKKLKLFYNPNSGDKSFKDNLDVCIEILQTAGYETHIFRSLKYGDIEEHFKQMDSFFYDAIVVSGGDGTINIVVNCIKKYNIKTTLGIIPSGTANDFASFIKLPNSISDCAKVIANGKTQRIDLGLVNEDFFINVCAAGLFTNVSQLIDKDFKYTLGKLAYYIDGVKQVPSFVPIPVKITNSNEVIKENIYLFLVLNTSGAGGFKTFAPTAKIDDGKFDFIAFKETTIKDIAILLIKMINSDYLDDPSVIYFKDSYIKIELDVEESEINPIYLHSDVDGEQGPSFPIEINCIPQDIELFIP
jgi:diacylglycerol kinase (ATP)